MKKTPIQEIDYFDFPSDYLDHEKFFAYIERRYPWLKWLLGAVVIISVLHFVLF